MATIEEGRQCRPQVESALLSYRLYGDDSHVPKETTPRALSRPKQYPTGLSAMKCPEMAPRYARGESEL